MIADILQESLQQVADQVVGYGIIAILILIAGYVLIIAIKKIFNRFK